MNTTAEAAERPPGIPWISHELQQRIAWRDGDVVISVPPKSGTTWTMNIVHQLLNGGTADFRDIYEEVPWIEFVAHPGETHDEILARFEAMPKGERRAFKSHSAPPGLPYVAPGSGAEVKYIVVCRNPEEAVVSFRPFLEQHSDAWFDMWQMPKAVVVRPDFPSFYREVVDSHGMQGAFFGFLAAWWALREAPNVLLVHYSDMKRDHEGSLRRIAGFLGVAPTEAQWPAILDYTSFGWMKRHEDKFELRTAGEVTPLNPGAMIRQGKVGKARDDGMTDEIAQHMRMVGGRICPDAQAVEWIYKGGPLP